MTKLLRLRLKSKISKHSGVGFTLVEILIVSGIGSLVITAIGSIIISQIRQNINFELRRQLAQDWAYVAGFIESELFQAERIYPVDGTITTGSSVKDKATSPKVCDFDAASIRLSLVLNDTTTYVTYAVTSIESATAAEKALWSGPYVLRRCGPLSTATNENGALMGSISNSILIDELANVSALSATRGINTLGAATASRDVRITLNISRSTVSQNGTFGGQARVSPSYNLINDEANTSSSCGSPSTTALLCGNNTTLKFTTSNCPTINEGLANEGDYTNASRTSIEEKYNCDISRVHQFKPTGITTVIGSTESSREDTIYFPGNLSDYKELTPTECTSKKCIIESNETITDQDGNPIPQTKVTVYEGEVLVFRDTEIRI